MKNRNASPSLFGWRFQIDSAIWLFFNGIKEIDEIRVEGSKEDVEFIYNSGTKCFVQAKSTISPDVNSDRSTVFSRAIETLSDAAKSEDNCRFIYVSNYDEPIPDGKSYILSNELINYSELPKKLTDYIDKKIERCINGDSIDVSDFYILRIPYPSTENGIKQVKSKIRDFMISIDEDYDRLVKNIYNDLLNLYFENGTNVDLNVYISKKQVATIILLNKMDLLSDSRLVSHLSLDITEYEQALRHLGNLIQRKSEQFSLITKVRATYRKYKSINIYENGIDEITFLEDSISKALSLDVFSKSFEDLDEVEMNAFYILIYRILKTKYLNEKISKEANICI